MARRKMAMLENQRQEETGRRDTRASSFVAEICPLAVDGEVERERGSRERLFVSSLLELGSLLF